MARSSDPRHPLPAERGAKRIGAIGNIVPGDDVEVAREIARIWDWISRLRLPKEVAAAPPAGSPSLGQQQLHFSWSWASGTPTITYVDASTGDLLCDLADAAANKRVTPLEDGVYAFGFVWWYNNWSSVVDKALTLRIDAFTGYAAARSTLRALSTGFPQHSDGCDVVSQISTTATFYPAYMPLSIVHGGPSSYPTTADGDIYVNVQRIS